MNEHIQIAGFILSVIAAMISATALGWNIYRDVILKPKLRVNIAFGNILNFADGGNPGLLTNSSTIRDNSLIAIEAVNEGPGQVKCTSIITVSAPFPFRRIRGFIRADDNMQLTDKLPKILPVGETICLMMPLSRDCFLSHPILRVGIKDAFGRVHWANPNSLRQMKRAFRKMLKEKR